MMKKMILTACLTMLSACGGALLVPISSGGALGFSNTSGPVAPPISTSEDVNFGKILNNLRITNGVGTVTYNAQLDAAAQAHAEDMATNNYFSHVSQDGRTALDRIKASGYSPRAYGENIAGRQQSDGEVLDAWINSARHNEILNVGKFDDFALGVAGEGSSTRWVLLMGQD